MKNICRIDKSIYECITKNIKTDEVIITNERINHINEHHPNSYDIIYPFLSKALEAPDYILEDKKYKDTGLVLKNITDNNVRMQVVLKIQTSSENPEYKNSIISAWQISESRWENYIKNRKILYKSK